MPILEVENLSVTFSMRGQKLYAVRGIHFQIEKGESVGIVGESGCGKSAAAQAINCQSPGVVTGKVLFNGKERKKPDIEIGMVFQDPMSALNPTMRIGNQIIEGLIFHKIMKRKEALQKAIEILDLVGVSDPKHRIHQYPHQFSGGMRQRVLIAMALICNPKLLIADEPTTALDATTQEQIIDLIYRMRSHFQMSLLLISHDISVIARSCDRILVMYAGKIVESGAADEILKNPKHPYTQMLLHSIPRLDRPKSEPLLSIEGSPPNLMTLPKGCAFKERCPFAAIQCNQEPPPEKVSCWRAQRVFKN